MKKISTNVWLYVPKAYNHDQMPAAFAGMQNEAWYILHRIIVGRNQRRHDADGFTRLNAKTLQRFIHPSIETRIRRMLIEQGVIECDDSYQSGHRSKGYRIAPAYLGGLRRVECTNPTLASKILRNRNSKYALSAGRTAQAAVHDHLQQWHERIEINLTKALQAIPQSDTSAPELNRMTCETIFHKEWEFIVCPQGRVHTNVTRLLSECRDYLTIDGERLVNIDIRNSQIVFFALMFLENRRKQLHPELPAPIGENPVISEGENNDIAHPQPPQPTTPPAQPPQHNSPSYTDLVPLLSKSERLFVDLTMRGQIYNYLMERADFQLPRDKFKQKFFCHVIYGDSSKHYIAATPLATLFRAEFPTIYDFMLEQKNGDFTQFPRAMQQRESDFMIGRVCERLRVDYPAVPVVTIHDSILTTPENEQLVRQIMLQEFEQLGITPSLSVPTQNSSSLTASQDN